MGKFGYTFKNKYLRDTIKKRVSQLEYYNGLKIKSASAYKDLNLQISKSLQS